ncbi:MAG TPA: L,D-transpeptidase [Patescibacteria group bacterium]|jgi:lipoprotein-anchoring transpeptidase ErfK/SrfK|nr:L,D-transpeptidase [Patescibacteria group bacterium]
MTFNQDQPPSKSIVSSGKSRGLLWIVIAGVVVMVLLGVTITTLFVQGYSPGGRFSSTGPGAVSISEIQSTIDQSTLLKSQPTATETEPLISGEELVTPKPTEKSAYLIQPKEVVAGAPKNRQSWTATPLPTKTPTSTPSPVPTFVSDDSYSSSLRPHTIANGEKWIDVNLTSQTLVAFEGNAPVFQSLVSSGTAKHPTVTGQFRIWLRFASQDMNGRRLGYDYFLKDVPYVQYFYQDYALHGTFWHNNFGTPMSHGCVNLPTSSAEWLFNWANNGTLVNIHK